MERNLTTGSVLKTDVLSFDLLSYFLQTLYGMADLFIVGQFDGVASTTAVSVGSQVMHMLTVMIVGLAMGTTVTIGQAVGAKNREKNLTDHRQYGDLILHCLCGDDGIFPLHGAANRGCDVHAGRSSGGNGSVSDDLFCWYSVYHSI
mgnify:CR=1 FL=1